MFKNSDFCKYYIILHQMFLFLPVSTFKPVLWGDVALPIFNLSGLQVSQMLKIKWLQIS